MLKLSTKNIESGKYLTNWVEFLDLDKKSTSEIHFWIESYFEKLKIHLSKSMYFVDNETIALLRTYCVLNSLEREKEMNKQDFEFLNLEWALEISKLIQIDRKNKS